MIIAGAFSAIVKTDCETDGSFYSTSVDVEEVAELDFPPTKCREWYD